VDQWTETTINTNQIILAVQPLHCTEVESWLMHT